MAKSRINHLEMLRKTKKMTLNPKVLTSMQIEEHAHKSGHMTYCFLSILYLAAAINTFCKCIIIAVSRKEICLAEKKNIAKEICTPATAEPLCSKYGE